MEPQIIQKTSAKDFFLHLASQVALYAVLINLVNLLFRVINKTYPQVNSGYFYYSGSYGISFPVALIIIVFPIFILLNYFIEKEFVSNPELRNLWIRKWLVYITLFVSGLIVVGDLVSVLYYFLDGQELTVGFLLKVSVMFVVSGLVFLYYLNDIREKFPIKIKKISALVSALVMIGVIVLAFSVMGSPKTQRFMNYDDTKINDLMSLSGQVNSYYQTKKALPNKLEDMQGINYYTLPVNPQSSEPYKYEKISDIKYKLCTEFNFDYDENRSKNYYGNRDIPIAVSPISIADPYNRNLWQYKKGQHCFDLEVPKYVIEQSVYSKPIPAY